MSFGGGSTQYFIDYIIRVSNQGGAGGFTQVTNSMNQLNTASKQTTVTMQQLTAAKERVVQASQGVSKAAKGMAFGFIGIATAGAEAIGMFGMYQQTATAVADAQKEVDRALKESGKNSKDYKDATNELVKAQRWQRMTQRNLMLSFFDLVPFIVLSINGILKFKTALKALGEAKAAQAALQKLGVATEGVATSMVKGGVSVTGFTPQLSKLSSGMVVARTASMKFTAEGIKQTAMFGGAEAALLRQASATNVATKATGGLSKAMRVLGIAMKIAIPLVILEIASQAFQNNWGGFADKVNALGKAFGDAVPAAKGLLDIVGKIGRSIAAIFTGNFDQIGEIWNGVTKAQEENTAISEKQQKAQEELRDALIETGNAGSDLITEFVEMDKKARKTFLFEHGIKGGAKDRFTDVAKGLDKLKGTFHNFVDDIKLIRLDEQLGNWFNLPKSFYKKIEFTFEDRFKALGKSLGDKGLTNLGKEMEKAAKAGKGFEGFKQAVINAVHFDPTLMDKLRILDPEAYTEFKKIMDEDAAKMKATAQSSISNAFSDFSLIGTGTPGQEGVTVNENGKLVNKKISSGAGPFQGIVDMFKKGFEQLQLEVGKTDWQALGNTVRLGVLRIFNVQNMQNLGAYINNNFITPLKNALTGAFGPWITDLQKDPIGTIMQTANAVGAPIGAFVAGLLGFKDEATMDKEVETEMEIFFAQIIHAIDNAINNNVIIWDLLHGDIWGALVETINLLGAAHEVAKETHAIPQQNPADVNKAVDPSITGVINAAWARVTYWANQNQWLLQLLSGNPLGALIEFLRVQGEKAQKEGKAQAPVNEGLGAFFADLDKRLKEFFSGQKVNGIPVNVPIIPTPVILGKHGGPAETTGSQANEFAEGNEDASMFKALSGWVSDQKVAPIPKDVPVQVVPKLLGPNGGDFGEVMGSQANDFAAGSEDNNQLGSIIEQWWNGIWGSWTPTSSGDNTGGNIGQPTWMKEGTLLKLSLPVAIQPQITRVSDQEGGDKKGMGSFEAQLVDMMTQAVAVFDKIGQFFNEKVIGVFTSGSAAWQGQWADDMTNMSAVGLNTFTVLQDGFTTMNEQAEEEFNAMEENWQNAMDNVLSSGEDTTSSIQDAFTEMNEQAEEEFNAMEENWANAMDNMVSDAKSAASDINSAIQGIKDKTVTVHVQRVGEVATGGQLSFAQGGVISAAGGRMLTTRGPTYVIGDNPGGQESIWAIPHNNPGPTVADINNYYGTGGKSGGSAVLNQQVTLNISGNEIVNPAKIDKKIRMTIGKARDRFG